MSRFVHGPNDEVERLSLEIAKLRAELDAFERPPHKNPSVLIAALTTLVAVVGIVLQWYLSNTEYIRAQTESTLTKIEREHTKAEVAQLQVQRSALANAVGRLNQEYDSAASRRAGQEQQLDSIQKALARVQATPGVGVAGRNEVAVAAALVQEVREANVVRAQEIQNGLQQVEQVRAELRFLNSPGAAAIVTGGFDSIEQARRDMNTTQVQGFAAAVFYRNGKFRTAIWYPSRDSASAKLPDVRERIRKSAYMVNWREWCPGVSARDEHYDCRPSTPERVIH